MNFATPVNKIMYLKGAGSTKFNLGDGQSHTFKVLLRVCGYETISPVNTSVAVFNGTVSSAFYTVNVADYFTTSSDRDCNETVFSLTSDQSGT